jgi:uncharacterized protein YegP (UPF0339 family)
MAKSRRSGPVEIYQGTGHKWRWRLFAENGEILVPFSSHYHTPQDAYDAAHRAAESLRDWLDSATPELIDRDDTTPIG